MSNSQANDPNQKPKEEAKEALREAIASIDSPEKAEQVVEHLETKAAGLKEVEVAEQMPTPSDADEAAQAIKQAAQSSPAKPEAVITQTAAEIAAAEPEEEEVLAEAVVEAVNPEAAAEPSTLVRRRRWLREALLKRLDPANGMDVRIFLAVNQLPHNKLTNSLMYTLTTLMTGGWPYVIGLFLRAQFSRTRRDRRYARRAFFDVLPALWLTTTIVDYPIKYYFRRRRPFIAVVRAIVVGRKPGSYSFPSGHSAAAFAGALLLSRHYPRRAPFFSLLAALVGFSRIYVGAHYPGDVVSGGTLGMVLAAFFRWLFAKMRGVLD